MQKSAPGSAPDDERPPMTAEEARVVMEEFRDLMDDSIRLHSRVKQWYEAVKLEHRSEIRTAMFAGTAMGTIITVLIWLAARALFGGGP